MEGKCNFAKHLGISVSLVMLIITISTQPQEAFAEQFGRPDQTISNTDWTVVGAGIAHQAIDEEIPNGDIDYIIGTSKTADTVLGLPDFLDPNESTDHTIRYNAYAEGNKNEEQVQIRLFQGLDEIVKKKFTITRDSYNTYSYTLKKGEADSITDYTDLRIQLEITKIKSGGEIRITQVEFEVPGDPPVEQVISKSSSNSVHEPPTIGKNLSGDKQMVENGICIDKKCWNVTEGYHQEFKLLEMLTGTHTISLQIFCNQGVERCNYAAVGIMPIDSDFNSKIWKIAIKKDSNGEWKIITDDSQDYLGEITFTTQIIDEKYLGVSFTINFKNKSTEQMKLGVQLRDTKNGVRNFFFNEGVRFVDVDAYPHVETVFDPPLKIEPLCLKDEHMNRDTCGFGKIREYEIKRAEETLKSILKKFG